MISTKKIELIRVVAASRKNRVPDKPNEDAYWFSADKRVLSVADGVTCSRQADGCYPDPSPASEVAKIVTSTVAAAFCARHQFTDTESRIREVFRLATENVRAYVNTASPSRARQAGAETPAAVATVLAFESGYAFFAHIGDCAIIKFVKEDLRHPQRLTDDQTAAARRWLAESSPEGRAERLNLIKTVIRNRRDNPLSFGVLNGEREGLRFLQVGKVKICSGDLLLLCSDGLEPALANLDSDARLRDLIGRRDVEKVLDYTELTEERLHLRSDDKTLILIDVV